MKTKFQLNLIQIRQNQKNQRKKVKRVKKAKKLARADFDLWPNLTKSNDEEEFKKILFRLKAPLASLMMENAPVWVINYDSW